MTDPLQRLVHQLSRLPGIGERTATRLAFYILRAPGQYVGDLAEALVDVKQKLKECEVCCQLTDQDPCHICIDSRRDETRLMVVALPQELLAIDRTGGYRGKYHVLHGLLSPLDGVGPDQLRIRKLVARLADSAFEEVVLALSPNVEGDATSLYLTKLLKPLGVRITRIASGVPIGGELEYADGVTLNRAIEARREV